jgi:cell division protein FtsQ
MSLRWRKVRPVKVNPRANARSESALGRHRAGETGGYWSRLGRGLLITLRVVATVTVLVGGCSGLFVLAREVGPLTREWFLVRSVSVSGLHHVTRKEVIGRLALKPDTALYSINPSWLADRIKTHPWIKDATVVLKPLHEIHIDIVEREPAVVVRTLAENLLADSDGFLLAHLGSSGRSDPADVVRSRRQVAWCRENRTIVAPCRSARPWPAWSDRRPEDGRISMWGISIIW